MYTQVWLWIARSFGYRNMLDTTFSKCAESQSNMGLLGTLAFTSNVMCSSECFLSSRFVSLAHASNTFLCGARRIIATGVFDSWSEHWPLLHRWCFWLEIWWTRKWWWCARSWCQVARSISRRLCIYICVHSSVKRVFVASVCCAQRGATDIIYEIGMYSVNHNVSKEYLEILHTLRAIHESLGIRLSCFRGWCDHDEKSS